MLGPACCSAAPLSGYHTRQMCSSVCLARGKTALGPRGDSAHVAVSAPVCSPVPVQWGSLGSWEASIRGFLIISRDCNSHLDLVNCSITVRNKSSTSIPEFERKFTDNHVLLDFLIECQPRNTQHPTGLLHLSPGSVYLLFLLSTSPKYRS